MQLADVRAAAAADAATISRLLADAIRGSYHEILGEIPVHRLVSTQCALPRIRAEIEIPGGAPGWLGWLVATDGSGAIVGAVAGGVPVPGEGELYALCVAEAARRRGVGAALLSAATERMRTFGAGSQHVTLPSTPDPSLPFYTHQGFTPLTPTRLAREL
ncbi:GNAT family N-acetyltransferase [Streptomyces sp. P9(2023)]|uniref:GNAT family N-acetyltransferase n=1 Tax=Streptomyces sp. P9(2023) TaxID=3064394 RepID=UPI0028F44EB8|nr:GNAT family N-acetyltransferase [Streptomyces sp. P9(2023)]MDT9693207.1 GNAT family N-acetyltransferase [Streptomyces sp. P9(2023)]